MSKGGIYWTVSEESDGSRAIGQEKSNFDKNQIVMPGRLGQCISKTASLAGRCWYAVVSTN